MSFRRQRAAHDVRDRLASIVEFEVRDPRVSGVSLLEVELSADYSYARIFFRTLGDAEEAKAGLESSRGFIRKRLAEQVKLRRIPELDFRYDESVDRGGRIDQILREIRDEDEADDTVDELGAASDVGED